MNGEKVKTIGIIQARMGSTRLPGKVLAEVGGHPMLRHVVTRASKAQKLESVLVATTTDRSDDPVESFCRATGIPVFRGSVDDVLERYYRAARSVSAQSIARITGDCPLIDPGLIDEVVSLFLERSYDYASNVHPPTYPDGLDTEVFSFAALERAFEEARLPSEREHVTSYMVNHPELFRLGAVRCDRDYSHMRWTVDEAEDLAFVRAVFDEMKSEAFGMRDVIALLEEKSELAAINADIKRNEGYEKSLKKDRPAGRNDK